MKKNLMVKYLKEDEQDKARNPIWYIVMVFLILIIVLMVVPYSGINKNPRPKEIISLDEAIDDLNLQGYQMQDLNMRGVDTDILIIIARRIGRGCDDVDDVCYTKAFYYFVRDEIKYIPDPESEFYESPEFTLQSGAADCDGKSILLSALLRSIDIQSRIVLGNNHAYVQAYLPGALSVYKTEGDWVSLDSTSNKDFGEINPKYLKNIKSYVFF